MYMYTHKPMHYVTSKHASIEHKQHQEYHWGVIINANEREIMFFFYLTTDRSCSRSDVNQREHVRR